MGLLDFLFGGKRKRTNIDLVPDRIWLTTSAKFSGLANEAQERSKSDTVAILLVAHFPDVLEKLDTIVNSQRWEVPCKAVLASSLNANLAASLNTDNSATIDMLVGERHPLPSVDDRLKDFADELPGRCRFSHHVSLDDPVIKVFAGDWIKNVLKQLGMADDEAIESELVSRRIRTAQQKIESRKLTVMNTQSAAEWLEKNCPDLVPK